MPFPKFVYSMAHQPGKGSMMNEIIRQAGKQFGCEVYQVREKGKRQKDNYDPQLLDRTLDSSESNDLLYVGATEK